MKQLFSSLSVIVLLLFPFSTLTASSETELYYRRSGIHFYDPDDRGVCDYGSRFEGSANIPDGTLEDYINKFGDITFEIGKQYGIPYEAILAQSAHESGWGRSGLTRNANNFFGIKAGSNWDGPVLVISTEEFRNGRMVTEQASFRAYPDAYEGFRGYAEFIIANNRYAAALNHPGDPIAYITEVAKAGYATDPEYISKVSRTINTFSEYIAENELYPPSSEVEHDTSPPAASSSTTYCDAPSGDIARVLEIAEAELAKSPVEYDANVMKYTTGREEAWCADFVSWVFKEAGMPFSGGAYEDWQIPAVSSLRSWFRSTVHGGEYFAVGEKMPRPGDVAFYIGSETPDRGSTSHTNIVISVNEGNGTMVTIGGNEGDKVTKSTRRIELGAQSLVGFGRINR